MAILQQVFGFLAGVWMWLMDNLIIINLILSIIIIFFQRKEPRIVWAWLLVLYFIPILGFILYLVLGQDMHKSRMFKVKEIEDKLNFAIKNQEEFLLNHELDYEHPIAREYADLVLYNLEIAGSVFTQDNEVEIYTDGIEKFDKLIEDILAAENYIHIQYYIIRDDELFDRIREALVQKAREGLEVRVLFDSMGCRSVKPRVWKELEKEGVKTGEFFPAILRRLQLRVNYRNHRKIVVIDGKVGYVGGFNIGREYISKDPKFGYWRDTHLRMIGSSVMGLQIRFALDWNYTTKENLFKHPEYFVEHSGYGSGNKGVQIIPSGPDSQYNLIHDNYLRMIHKAKKSIYIQTPYFIPNESILSALKIAARSGVDVRLMIPCKPDHPFVYWATYSYMGDLLDEGAKCYIYENGFLHSKGIIVDGLVCCYGTANMDIRSFELNFEVNAIIYDEGTAKEMEEIFREDMKLSRKMTKAEYAKRPLIIRLKEQCFRLLSPLL